ncbi:MAG: D-amino acid aminotransferase [Gammaproteobacteria bacterium]|jgi:D-alanine transaminase|nr:D-amino acid aminotransferase [Gammaproteobacteria bacterium]|tara:strand:- start:1998 stop:2858 length:861 start_codon:yes stop_codon:yes gene_type:complete
MAIAYLNGEWQAPEEAKISIFDRGFMFGDGVYEVMPIYWQQVFTLDEHLMRLRRSLDEIRITPPFSDDEWKKLFAEAIERSGEETAFLYLQVTRGIAATRDHAYPVGVKPTVLVTVTAAPMLERESVVPYRMVTKADFRWGRGDIKVVSLIANGLLKNEALDEGFDDAILIRDGLVTESTLSNLFIVKDGIIITPPESRYLLHGITREHIIGLARSANLPLEERSISEEELADADEIWISSTGHEAWPVGELNGKIIGNGEGGVVWQSIDTLFQESKKKMLTDAER